MMIWDWWSLPDFQWHVQINYTTRYWFVTRFNILVVNEILDEGLEWDKKTADLNHLKQDIKNILK